MSIELTHVFFKIIFYRVGFISPFSMWMEIIPPVRYLFIYSVVRFDLERESLRELSSELRRLYTLGYRWSHGYTQCRLQAMLYAFRHE